MHAFGTVILFVLANVVSIGLAFRCYLMFQFYASVQLQCHRNNDFMLNMDKQIGTSLLLVLAYVIVRLKTVRYTVETVFILIATELDIAVACIMPLVFSYYNTCGVQVDAWASLAWFVLFGAHLAMHSFASMAVPMSVEDAKREMRKQTARHIQKTRKTKSE